MGCWIVWQRRRRLVLSRLAGFLVLLLLAVSLGFLEKGVGDHRCFGRDINSRDGFEFLCGTRLEDRSFDRIEMVVLRKRILVVEMKEEEESTSREMFEIYTVCRTVYSPCSYFGCRRGWTMVMWAKIN